MTVPEGGRDRNAAGGGGGFEAGGSLEPPGHHEDLGVDRHMRRIAAAWLSNPGNRGGGAVRSRPRVDADTVLEPSTANALRCSP